MSDPSENTGGMIALSHLENIVERRALGSNIRILGAITSGMRNVVLQGLNTGFYQTSPELHARALDAYYASLPDQYEPEGYDLIGSLLEAKP